VTKKAQGKVGLQALGIQSWPALLLKSKFKLENAQVYLCCIIIIFSMQSTVGDFSVAFNFG